MLQHYWDFTIRLFSVISRTLVWGSYSPAEAQSVYSTAPANWAEQRLWYNLINWWMIREFIFFPRVLV